MRTKFLSLFLLGVAVLPCRTTAREGDPRLDPKLNPKRIINQSSNFLKEREPDLTAEEDALYEKATQLLTTQPAFAVKLLEGLEPKPETKEPANPAFELLLGNAYYAAGETGKAEARYLSAVDRYPSFLRGWTNLGVLYYAQGHHEKAIPCLAKAVALGDRESTTFGMLGLCLEQTGDAVGAELAFTQALAADPGNGRWMDALVGVFMRAKQYSRAEIMVRNLIKARPTEPKYWLIYANIMVATDRKLEAIALLEQTASTGIAGDEELATLAGLYADENLTTEAARTYQKINVTAQALGERKALQLVRILMASAEWQKAETLLGDIAKLGVEGRETLLQTQADLLAAQKKWGAARTVLNGLLKLNPMQGTALVSLGRIYLAEGDEVHATLVFEAAVQTKEGAHPASLELANLELKHRHYDRSASYLEQALAIEKNQDVEDILTRVRSLVAGSEQTKT
jgi:predicted Zn-dependent protease